MPHVMKAAVLESIGGPLRIRDLTPQPLEYGQVLVDVHTSGICGAQLQEIDGLKGNRDHLPHLLGHEGVGTVKEIGPGVTHLRPKQRVVMHWRVGKGIEAPFPTYTMKARNGTKTVGSGRVVTFTEQAVVSENRLTVVPDDTPGELCALLGCSLSTALGIVERDANLLFGERVLIIGCGGLGLNLIRASALRGASRIAVIERTATKDKLAYKLGATHFLSGNWQAAAIMEGREFDAIFDTVGSPRVMEEAFPYLAPSGRYIMVGQPAPTASLVIPKALRMFLGAGQVIRATQGGGFQPDRDIPRYVALWRSGRLNLEGIVSDLFPLAKVNDAIDLVRSGEAGRVFLSCKS
jgi:S-(hydroxymethyl)glutathione dehydrogenase/alcohol dehydrogenase